MTEITSHNTQPEHPADSKGPILVVEDDSFLRRLLVTKLKRERFEVAEAASGGEALEYLKTHNPSLVLLDLLMPGVDGFQVLEALRAQERIARTPVIVLSNLGEQQHVDRAKSLGADDYLVKAHFVLDEIMERISKVLSERYL